MTVDDNAKMRAMVKRMLAPVADQFHECSDGSEAVVAYEKYRPDWTVMDIVMKEVDGITATKAIKQSFPEAKIIILTQHNDPRLREEAMSAGAFEFVLKENLIDIARIIAQTT